MQVEKRETLPIRTEEDIVTVRQVVRRWCGEVGFGLVDQTKIVTAASELGRNALVYGRGGVVELMSVVDQGRRGLALKFDDNGPGIADVELALRDGYTTGRGLGLGLGGARRLMNEFEVRTTPGAGTTVTVARWKH